MFIFAVTFDPDDVPQLKFIALFWFLTLLLIFSEDFARISYLLCIHFITIWFRTSVIATLLLGDFLKWDMPLSV